MGRKVYIEKIRDFIKKTPVFRVKDIEVLVGRKDYANLIIHKLAKNGEVKRIIKGFYSYYDDPILIVFCLKPSYIGLQEALSIHNIWEQETNTVVITTRKVRTGIREILENNVLIRRIHPKYFFGFELVKYGNFYVPVSDPEKTLIDFFYFKINLERNVLEELLYKVDKNKLEEYLQKYPEKFRKTVYKKLKEV